ncbi:hypothetical protein PR048_020642 [Dryococelus australis]|uniref:Uncharacterized protein n=1 Tax=Dryococelus australis TaxID=614101 RepID=A0ABQ9H6V1_9NEOP|nr:hypothetical protein PR048_020642 [Dryococelus australis]
MQDYLAMGNMVKVAEFHLYSSPAYCVPYHCSSGRLQTENCDSEVSSSPYLSTEDERGRFPAAASNLQSEFMLAGKSKVAPVKSHSLPNLELCSGGALVSLTDQVLEIYSTAFPYSIIHAWTLAGFLSWIDSSPHQLKTSVANRVNEMHGRLLRYCMQCCEIKPSSCYGKPANQGSVAEEALLKDTGYTRSFFYQNQ